MELDNVLDVPKDEFIDIAVGLNYACGMKADNSLLCWGSHRYPSIGEYKIHVFYCTSTSEGYTASDLQHEVDLLNDTVARFYAEQSSSLVSLEFIPGGVISPNIDWENPEPSDTNSGGYSTCEFSLNAVERFNDHDNTLILRGLWPLGGDGGEVFGYGSIGGGDAAVVTVELILDWVCPNREQSDKVRDLSGSCRDEANFWYHGAIAHELGHSLFSIGHPDDGSIMAPEGYRSLNAGYIGCTIRGSLGWQCASPQQSQPALTALYNATDGPNWADSTNWNSDQPLDTWHGVNTGGGGITYLSLHGNNLTGTIPPQIGNLSGLIILHLGGNSLTGAIPEEIGNLTGLAEFNLHGNNLSGPIPLSFAALTELGVFHAMGNSLCLPEELRSWHDAIEYKDTLPAC